MSRLLLNPYAFAAALGLSFITSATSSTASIDVPATAQAGDLVVIMFAAFNTPNTAPSAALTSGWTSDAAASGTDGTNGWAACIVHKVIVSGDVSAAITGYGSVTTRRNLALVFRPTVAIVSVTAVSPNQQAATTSAPTTQTVAMSGQAAPVLALGHSYSSAQPTFSGTLTSAGTQLAGNSVAQRGIYEIITGTPADLTLGQNDVGTNTLCSVALVLT